MYNMFMVFHFENDEVARFGYVVAENSVLSFFGTSQVGLLKEEDVVFPPIFMHGDTRRALVHYVDGQRRTAFVPVLTTDDDLDKYDAAFRR